MLVLLNAALAAQTGDVHLEGGRDDPGGDRPARRRGHPGEFPKLLAAHTPDPAYGHPPSARTIFTPAGTWLFVTYNLLGSRHDSSPTVRVLIEREGRYRRVVTTGDDLPKDSRFVLARCGHRSPPKPG